MYVIIFDTLIYIYIYHYISGKKIYISNSSIIATGIKSNFFENNTIFKNINTLISEKIILKRVSL